MSSISQDVQINVSKRKIDGSSGHSGYHITMKGISMIMTKPRAPIKFKCPIFTSVWNMFKHNKVQNVLIFWYPPVAELDDSIVGPIQLSWGPYAKQTFGSTAVLLFNCFPLRYSTSFKKTFWGISEISLNFSAKLLFWEKWWFEFEL